MSKKGLSVTVGCSITFDDLFSISIDELSNYFNNNIESLRKLAEQATGKDISRDLNLRGGRFLKTGVVSKKLVGKNNTPRVTSITIKYVRELGKILGSNEKFSMLMRINFGDYESVELCIEDSGQLGRELVYIPTKGIRPSRITPILIKTRSLNGYLEDIRGRIYDIT